MAASIVFLALAFRASRQKLKIHRLPCLARLRVATGFGWLCFICLRFALAINKVASCSALRAVMVFAEKAKTHASPPLLHVPSTALVPRALCSPPLLHSQVGSRKLGQCPQPVPLSLHSLQPLSSLLAAGAFSCFLPTAPVPQINSNSRDKRRKRKEYNYKTSRQKPKKQSKDKSAYRAVKFKPCGFL